MGEETKAVAGEPAEPPGDATEYEHWFGYFAKLEDLQGELRKYTNMPCEDATSALNRLQCMDDVRHRIAALKTTYGVDLDTDEPPMRGEFATAMHDNALVGVVLAGATNTMETPTPSVASGTGLLQVEAPADRRKRRLARLRELGADMRPAGEGWQVTGRRGALADLCREEKAAGRPMSDKSNVRNDLAAAMGDQRGS